MSLDLNQLLDLSVNFSKIKLLSITGDDLNNCSFLIHSLISSKVRSCRNQTNEDNPILVLILLNNSYTHYSSVAAKSFGLNFKALKESGKLIVLDVISNLSEYLDTVTEEFNFIKFCHDIQQCLSKINSMETGNETKSNTLVMIDDLSTLLSLQVSVSSVFKLVSRIRSFSFSHETMIVIQSHIDPESEDEEMNNLANSISSCSDVWIESRKLETGFSQSIDGSLCVHDYRNIIGALGKDTSRKYHFKTMERNTKIFVPGSGNLLGN